MTNTQQRPLPTRQGNADLVVLESHVMGKTVNPEACEDLLVVGPDLVAVIDGVTTERSGQGPSPGRLAAETAAAALVALGPEADARAAVDAVTAALLDAFGPPPRGRRGPALVFAAVRPARREVWRVGDCAVLVDGIADSAGRAMDEATSRARAAHLHCLLAMGADPAALRVEDPGRAMLRPLLDAQNALANRADSPFGYGVLDGSSVPGRFVETMRLPDTACEVVLATDGYPKALPTLAESEAALETVLREDPLMIRLHVSTKGVAPGNLSFDDRAYVRVALPARG